MFDPRRLRGPRGKNKQLHYIVCGFLGLLGLALYPTIISPFINPEPWRKLNFI